MLVKFMKYFLYTILILLVAFTLAWFLPIIPHKQVVYSKFSNDLVLCFSDCPPKVKKTKIEFRNLKEIYESTYTKKHIIY